MKRLRCECGQSAVISILFLTVLLCAVNPFVVGFTHGIGASAAKRAVHSGAAAPAVATAVALKKVPRLALKL